MTASSQSKATLREHIQVVRRRKWIVLAPVVLVPLVVLVFSLGESKLYQATADVLLSHQNLATSLTGTIDPSVYQQADRIAQTQVDLAKEPVVAQRVVRAAGLSWLTPRQLLAMSSVSARQNADLITFRVDDRSPEEARLLATEYARQFTIYRRELDTGALQRVRREVQDRIRQLQQSGDRRTALYASLVGKEQELLTMEALQTSNAFVVRNADEARQVRPRPLRNSIFGLAFGLVLGLGLALLREALDTRFRSADEIGDRLGLPLLARVPEPPRRLQSTNQLVMLAEPGGLHAEAFRMLRTNLDFVRLDRDARVIMVTSAVEQEGKSTTVANLALALARTGQRVLLVDLDLRRPYLARFFGLEGHTGLTQVVLGYATLDEAIANVGVPPASAGGSGLLNGYSLNGYSANGSSSNGHAPRRPAGRAVDDGHAGGVLEVLTSGPVPLAPGEFVGKRALADLLVELRRRADIVLVDAPPLLHVGDAMTLSSSIDAIILVTRLNVMRRPMIAEVRRQLETCPAARLGFVLTGADAEEIYGYGYGAYRYTRPYGRAETPKEPIA